MACKYENWCTRTTLQTGDSLYADAVFPPAGAAETGRPPAQPGRPVWQGLAMFLLSMKDVKVWCSGTDRVCDHHPTPPDGCLRHSPLPHPIVLKEGPARENAPPEAQSDVVTGYVSNSRP